MHDSCRPTDFFGEDAGLKLNHLWICSLKNSSLSISCMAGCFFFCCFLGVHAAMTRMSTHVRPTRTTKSLCKLPFEPRVKHRFYSIMISETCICMRVCVLYSCVCMCLSEFERECADPASSW